MKKDLCKILIDQKNWSKYGLAKKIGVSWNTVHMWYLGVFEPSQKHEEKLDEINQEKT